MRHQRWKTRRATNRALKVLNKKLFFFLKFGFIKNYSTMNFQQKMTNTFWWCCCLFLIWKKGGLKINSQMVEVGKMIIINVVVYLNVYINMSLVVWVYDSTDKLTIWQICYNTSVVKLQPIKQFWPKTTCKRTIHQTIKWVIVSVVLWR